MICKSPFSKCNDWELKGTGSDRLSDLQKSLAAEEARMAAVEAISAYLG